MSITDELREWIRARNMMAKETFDQLTAIANRIDAEHRTALEKVAATVEPDDKQTAFDALMGGFNLGRARGYDEGFKAHIADLEARVERIERLLSHKGER